MLRYWFVAAALLGACGDDGSEDVEPASTCPAELTYDSAAAPVVETYCLACHSSRNAAKLGDGQVIDSEARIREHGSYLYDLVLTGEMPKAGGPIPEAQKRDFLDWIECSGALASAHQHMH